MQMGVRMRFREEAHALGFDPLTVWCPRYSWCTCPAYLEVWMRTWWDRWELEGWSPQCTSEKEMSTLRRSCTWSRGSRGSAVPVAAFLSCLVPCVGISPFSLSTFCVSLAHRHTHRHSYSTSGISTFFLGPIVNSLDFAGYILSLLTYPFVLFCFYNL